MIDWDDYFISIAKHISAKSKDESTKVGAVIVADDNSIISTGYNGMPRGVVDARTERQVRPGKYYWFEHAERNAIYQAARNGVKTQGATLYLNFEPIPCADCTRAIIQAGIECVVGPDIKFPGKGEQWKESLAVSAQMFIESGVETRTVRNV